MVVTNPLFRTRDVQEAVNSLSFAGVEDRGAIFTKREVVDFILDLVGYSDKNDLSETVLLEPSLGDGDFLFAAVERLLNSFSKKDKLRDLKKIKSSIRGVELHSETFNKTRARLIKLLESFGINAATAEEICSEWLINDDFLLTDLSCKFSHVVGNPPYVRQEAVPRALMAEYRQRYKTIYDRADLYVPFIEKGLDVLSRDGSLGYICSEKKKKNQYGAPLRKMISEDFSLKYHVDMAGSAAFHTDVSAYTAVTVISRQKNNAARIAKKPVIDRIFLKRLAEKLLDDNYIDSEVRRLNNVPKHGLPWLLDGDSCSALIESLEKRFPTLEEQGCQIGIGVATGCDSVYIKRLDDLPVEKNRKLPLITTADIVGGTIKWLGTGIVNPFEDDGSAVDLKKYPKLKDFLLTHKEVLLKRSVAARNSKFWYRTIDKITKSLTSKPKLLIPDINLTLNVVYDEGKYYPHHNLYYVVSDVWNIRALQTILKSSVAHSFIAAYSTKMRGNYLRFQAQHLRRIRIPKWNDISLDLRRKLINNADSNDIKEINKLVYEAYSLTVPECAMLDSVFKSSIKA